jgi:hypothetical protein
MSSITLFDELIIFTNELIDLINQDWIKFKKFYKEHKKYMFWIFTLFITMQFTDIINLGNSWNKYCKMNSIKQYGGATPPPASAPAPAPAPASTPAAAPAAASTPVAAAATAASTPPPTTSKLKTRSLFRRTKSNFASSIRNNPVFGNLDKIFGAVSGMFMVIAFICLIVGIISLPVVIFIVITYCILKNLLTRFAIL